jgi:serine protease Do
MKRSKLNLLPLLMCPLMSPGVPSANAGEPLPGPGLELARQLNEAFVQVAEQVSPSVVVIRVDQHVEVISVDEDDEDSLDVVPREFRRYFRRRGEDPAPEKSVGQGSGLIIREDGYILTNGHVVEEAETIEVRLLDGRKFKAKVRGIDPQSDIAVLKIEATGLPAARLADSTKTRVGEFAIAIGAPFSLDYTVTFGHISAKGRSNIVPSFAGGAMMDQDFIQTDANINPGNSGGPLININGEVIGINTLIRGLRTGIGFAIPSALAKEVSAQLIAEGKFNRAWLGVEIQALRDDPDALELLKGVKDGVVVKRVLTNGPSSKSGLKPTDVIVAVEGKHVGTPQDLRGEIRGKKAGEPITLDVVRDGQPLQVKVSPQLWVDPDAATQVSTQRGSGATNGHSAMGITVHTITPDLAKQFKIGKTEGVLVVAVEKGTVAAKHGVRPGDIITSITTSGGQQAIRTPKQFREAIKKADSSKGVILNLTSDGASRFEVLKEED